MDWSLTDLDGVHSQGFILPQCTQAAPETGRLCSHVPKQSQPSVVFLLHVDRDVDEPLLPDPIREGSASTHWLTGSRGTDFSLVQGSGFDTKPRQMK